MIKQSLRKPWVVCSLLVVLGLSLAAVNPA
jgi:hypothetical protein